MSTPHPPSDTLDLARRVLQTEAAAILGLIPTLDVNFERAVDLLHDCAGRVIVTGRPRPAAARSRDSATHLLCA